jgi:tryptophan 2,3-dioxygenase
LQLGQTPLANAEIWYTEWGLHNQGRTHITDSPYAAAWIASNILDSLDYANHMGIQSCQYRAVEFILGNKKVEFLDVFEHDEIAHIELQIKLESPSLYDEFRSHLARGGHMVPRACLERDWREPYRRNHDLVAVFQRIYAAPADHWADYALCEKLVDLDEHFQLWRFRHLKAVERIIGYNSGTGGSAGASFLKKVIETVFSPELLAVRTEIKCSK